MAHVKDSRRALHAPGERRGRHRARAGVGGPGADWALETLPALLGADDDLSGFSVRHEVLAEAVRKHPGVRIGRTGRVMEALVPAVLEQKVVGREAWRAWRWLLTHYGEPAPGPAPEGMRVVPEPVVWRQIPSWHWHRAGAEAVRARTIATAAWHAGKLEAAATTQELDRLLRALPGVGVWTSAEVRQRALGDPDAVSVGDFHLAKLVGYALTGEKTDDRGGDAAAAGAVRGASAPGDRAGLAHRAAPAGQGAAHAGARLPVVLSRPWVRTANSGRRTVHLMSSDSALRRALARARDGKTLDVTEATVLLHARDGHLDTLLDHASRVRDAGLRTVGREGIITYSKKVFIPLTRLCRDRCGYCTFATAPHKLPAPFLSPDEVLEIARQGGRRWGARRRCSRWATGRRIAGTRRGSGSTPMAMTTRCPTSGPWRSGCWRRPVCCRTSTPGC
ncbi:hypothetical protein GCM10020001_061090 [Nonomuraea salmonea]